MTKKICVIAFLCNFLNCATVLKNKRITLTKKNSSNKLFCTTFFGKNVAFTKFLAKKGENFPNFHTAISLKPHLKIGLYFDNKCLAHNFFCWKYQKSNSCTIYVPEDPRSCLSKMFPPCRSLWQNTTGEFKYSTHFLKRVHLIFTALLIFFHFRKFTYLTQAISSTKLISRSRDAQFLSCTSPISSNKIPAIDSCHLKIRLKLDFLKKKIISELISF